MGLWSQIWQSFPLIPCPQSCSGWEICSLCFLKNGSISLLLLARINYHWLRIIIIAPCFFIQHLRSFHFWVVQWETPSFPFFFFFFPKNPNPFLAWGVRPAGAMRGFQRQKTPKFFLTFFFPSCPISPTRAGSPEIMENSYFQPTAPLRFIPVQLPQEFQPPF